MKLLLDTHVFLWYISADPQLPITIRDPANETYLSYFAATDFALAQVRRSKQPST
jgi:PIN domain nuclease of toxin-antitoxin system